MSVTRRRIWIADAASPALSIAPAWAKGSYDDGASDSEIGLGHISP